ncbi:hypothetical protein [Aeromicrobium ginsengisoli]|uniref:Tat pathway signal sequence domain protein n=1 Tax=Aeromicrobium ginsengisoli TaxID=363867 RepID=A0A5M4FGR7_9ACTN|nr:hypothetical protein [Aeromicrobium ginsengisoli]KAA1399409.1 hypothetical protein ESP70_001140 [Aeromicrobium ginsengisoli]
MNVSAPRRRTFLGLAPFAIATVAALLAAPSARTDAGVDAVEVRTSSARTASGSADLSNVVFLAAAPAPDPTPEPESGGAAVDEPDESAAIGELAISEVVMVANTDGSATLSATFTGGREAMALKAVSISTKAGALDVASTQMWLPIIPGKVSRAGDASDAGGFVVPQGLAAGQVVRVQFQFDNGTCAALTARTVQRTKAHDEVFPTDGRKLGPGRPTAFKAGCST